MDHGREESSTEIYGVVVVSPGVDKDVEMWTWPCFGGVVDVEIAELVRWRGELVILDLVVAK